MKCCICGREISGQYIEGSDGKAYCNETCWNAQFPKCAICGKPVNGGYTDRKTGKHYCGDACWKAHLPKCVVCGKPVDDGFSDKEGNPYCSQYCWEQRLPKCAVCGKPVNGGYTDKKTGKHYCSDACWDAHLPKCAICGKPVHNGYTDKKTGKRYCSDACWDAHLPKCHVCGSPVKDGFVADDGTYYCSDACWTAHLPKCAACGKPMTNIIVSKSTGKEYCSEECFSTEWPICHHCGKRTKSWYQAPVGDAAYCSTECLDAEWATCCICGQPTKEWITDREGNKFCSDACYHKNWKVCSTCGKEASKGVTDKAGKFYCSDHCWEESLAKCPVCGKPLVHYVIRSGNTTAYCSRECLLAHDVQEMATKATDYFMAGQLYERGAGGLAKDMHLAEAMYQRSAASGYQPAADRLEELGLPRTGEGQGEEASLTRIAANLGSAKETAKLGEIYARLSQNLEELQTTRGGPHGLKGFVAENLEAAEASSLGRATYVIDDNHAADLVFVGENGHKYYQQLKVGYHGNHQTFDFEKYRGQTLLVDKGNPNFARWKREGQNYGVNVVESSITKAEAERLADWMKWETSLTGSATATVIPKLAAAHAAGMKAGALGAKFGLGISTAINMVAIFKGDKKLNEAYYDIAKDVAVTYASSYAQGAVLSAVASTEAGAAAISSAKAVGGTATAYFLKTEVGKQLLKHMGASRTVAMHAAKAAGGIVGRTAVGKSTIAAGETMFGAGAFAQKAVERFGTAAAGQAVGMAGTVGGTIGNMAVAYTSGTAIGGAVASGVGTATAAGTAIGGMVVAAAPVVASAAAVCAVVSVGRKIFKWFSA